MLPFKILCISVSSSIVHGIHSGQINLIHFNLIWFSQMD